MARRRKKDRDGLVYVGGAVGYVRVADSKPDHPKRKWKPSPASKTPEPEFTPRAVGGFEPTVAEEPSPREKFARKYRGRDGDRPPITAREKVALARRFPPTATGRVGSRLLAEALGPGGFAADVARREAHPRAKQQLQRQESAKEWAASHPDPRPAARQSLSRTPAVLRHQLPPQGGPGLVGRALGKLGGVVETGLRTNPVTAIPANLVFEANEHPEVMGKLAQKLTPGDVVNADRYAKHYAAIGIPRKYGRVVGNTINDAYKTVAGAPAGVALAIADPRAAGRAVTSDLATRYGPLLKGDFQGFLDANAEHPLFLALDVVTVASAGAGAVGRASSVSKAARGVVGRDLAERVANLSRADRAAFEALTKGERHPGIERPSRRLTELLNVLPDMRLARAQLLGVSDEPLPLPARTGREKAGEMTQAALRPPRPGTRTIRVGEVEAHPLASKNPLLGRFQAHLDRRTQADLDRVEPLPFEIHTGIIKAKLAGPELKFGREKRAERRVAEAAAQAPLGQLEQFGKTMPARALEKLVGDRGRLFSRGKSLSAGEQKAIDVLASGLTVDEHLAYHSTAMQRAAAGDRTYGRPDDHLAQINLLQLAKRYELHPSENLLEAARLSRELIGKREQILALPPDQVAYRVGARYAEIKSLAAGEPSALLRRSQLSGEAADRFDALILAEGRRLIEEGAFYLPSRSLAPSRAPRLLGGRQASRYGYGPPQPNLPELKHRYTGALQRTGDFRTDVPGLVGEAYKSAQKYATLQRGFEQMLALAKPTRAEAGEQFAIPLRKTRTIPTDLRRIVDRADSGHLTAPEVQALEAQGTDIERLRQHFFPRPEEIADPREVVWIDQRLVGRMAERLDSGPLREGLDVLNRVGVSALLYLRPAYAINLLQNLGTHVMQAGVFAPANFKAAAQLGKHLGEDDRQLVFALTGQGKSRSLEPENLTGRGAAVTHELAEAWSAVTDRIPRAMGWLHEARREGFKSPEQLKLLLHHPELEEKLVEITRRANKEMIDYGSLTPLERSTLKRGVIFYGWLRASTAWSLRFPLEHPAQAALYSRLGEQGWDWMQSQWEERDVTAVPTFLKGRVPINVLGHELLVNPALMSTPSMPLETTEAVLGEGSFSGLGPVASVVQSLVTGESPLGYPSRGLVADHVPTRLGAAGETAASFLPLYGTGKTAAKGDKGMFPGGPDAAALQWAGGSAARAYDAEAIQEAGERDLGSTPEGKKRKLLADLDEIAKKAKVGVHPAVREQAEMLAELDGTVELDDPYEEKLAVLLDVYAKREPAGAQLFRQQSAGAKGEAAKEWYLDLREDLFEDYRKFIRTYDDDE